MYNVKVDLASLPAGAVVNIDGLGFFKNGSEEYVSDEAIQAFITKHVEVSYSTNKKGVMKASVKERSIALLSKLLPQGVQIKKVDEKDIPPDPVVDASAGAGVTENDEGDEN